MSSKHSTLSLLSAALLVCGSVGLAELNSSDTFDRIHLFDG
jgi:hypothetical protein